MFNYVLTSLDDETHLKNRLLTILIQNADYF